MIITSDSHTVSDSAMHNLIEINRIWSAVDIKNYKTGLARLKGEFNPLLLLNSKVKGRTKILNAQYRIIILTYAYELLWKRIN